MKRSTLLLSLLCTSTAVGIACSRPEPPAPSGESADTAGVAIGQIQGYAAVSKMLRIRLLDDSDPNTASFAVEAAGGKAIFAMKSQLGGIAQAGTQTEFQNGTAAPLGVALWHELFTHVGSAVGQVCSGSTTVTTGEGGVGQANGLTFPKYAKSFSVGGDPFEGTQSFRLFPAVETKIKAVCTFEGDASARSAAAGAFFDTFMGIGGSLAKEKEAFLSTFAADGSPFLSVPASDRVSAMTVALLLNPYFLLQR